MKTDGSNLRRTLASAVVLSVVCVLAFTAPSLATDAVNVFSGKWSTTSPGGPSGTITFKVVSAATGASELQSLGGQPCAAPTTYYHGDYSSLLLSGVLAGCTTTPGHLVGRFSAGSTPGDTGAGEITFAAPNTFSGHVVYQGASYDLAGTFVSHTPDDGCCPGAPPANPPPNNPPPNSPPPTTSPPGSSPPPSTPGGSSPGKSTPGTGTGTGSPISLTPDGALPTSSSGSPLPNSPASRALRGAGRVIVAEPTPGASVTIVSPNPIAVNAATVAFKVTDSLGDFPGSTIVASGGLENQPSGVTAACWLIGPDALQIPPDALGRSVDLKFFDGRLNASQGYNSCAAVARSIAAAPHASATASQAQGGGCAARPFEVSIVARGGAVTDARPLLGPAPGPSSPSYACRLAGNTLTISLDGRRKGGLAAALGHQLRVGVVRAADARARHATLTFAFGPSWTGSWHSTHGAMTLTQADDRVTGTYSGCRGKAKIVGQLSGLVLTGSWTSPCDSRAGRLHFVLAPDGQTFKGTWGYGPATPAMTWSGRR